MKKKIKLCFIITTLLFTLLSNVFSQNCLRILKNNGEAILVPLSEISKLTFSDNTIDTTLNFSNVMDRFFKLKAYPNPATDFVNIEYELTSQGSITIEIYNLTGKLINHILISDKGIGKHTYQYDLRNLKSGVYVFKLYQNNCYLIEKLIKTY